MSTTARFFRFTPCCQSRAVPAVATGLMLVIAAWQTPGWAQSSLPVSATQKATANEVAQKGVPLSELAPNAPDSYTVKAGDTLWAISALFLKSPWRWPELWGMNMKEIQNPHLIYPGQKLVLEKVNGRAVLKLGAEVSDVPAPDAGIPTVKVSPATRYSSLSDSVIPTLPPKLIGPYLTEAMIVDKEEFDRAPRIIATAHERVLLSVGERAYARSVYDREDAPMKLVISAGNTRNWGIFGNAAPLRDPGTREIIGYEAQHLGSAILQRSEAVQTLTYADGKVEKEPLPATLDILSIKQEIRVGDRLVPEKAKDFLNFAPRMPASSVSGQIVSVYGSGVENASSNQVVVLNRGKNEGLEPGHVLAIQRNLGVVSDKTDPRAPDITLPSERNGLLMVFRVFDHLSYALILGTTDVVRVGDKVASPR